MESSKGERIALSAAETDQASAGEQRHESDVGPAFTVPSDGLTIETDRRLTVIQYIFSGTLSAEVRLATCSSVWRLHAQLAGTA